MVKRKAKALLKSTEPTLETQIIRECVVYAQMVAAFEAGFAADPDGDSKNAEASGYRHLKRAEMALEKVNSMTALSAEAISSKARLIPIMLKHNHDCELEGPDRAYIESFAADVKRFLVPFLRNEFGGKSEKPQPKSAAA